MAKTKQVELRLPKDVHDDLARRVHGTTITLEQYINALLTVQVIEFLSRERFERERENRGTAQGKQS